VACYQLAMLQIVQPAMHFAQLVHSQI